MASRTLVIATGGTIDSAYDPALGTPEYVPTPQTSAIPKALSQLGWRQGIDYDFKRFYHKDSNHLHQSHMQAIAHYLSEHRDYDKVIITHGTDTMPRNGRTLHELMQHADAGTTRTIIMCGSMQPLRKLAADEKAACEDVFLDENHTDALRNLTLAMRKVGTEKSGVYLTDGDQLHNVFDVEKQREVAQGKVTHAQFVGRVHPFPNPDIDFISHT
ncbi:MAG: asparaginase [Rickettsiales bacterium]|nr:asparaginase [Rickettsiales bacterium]